MLGKIPDVTCPSCRRKDRLVIRTIEGAYRCRHCQHKLSYPSVSLSKQQVQALLSSGFRIRRILSIITVFAGFGLLVLVRSYSNEGQLLSSSSAPIASSSPTASPTSSLTPEPKPIPKPKPVRRPTDDNGVPFPTKSGYLKGYPALSWGGYSNVTVDNSQNNSDVFVKLFWLDTIPPKAARVFDCALKECGIGKIEVSLTPLTRDRMSALRSS